MEASTRPRADKPFISLVVPVYNEAHSIDLFLAAAVPTMDETGCDYELVFVNDGSRDATLEVLRAAKARHPQMVIVSLSRNFGKEAALTAGLDHARGDVVVPLDVDLQDPPELIHRFLDCWREGYDVVYGVRTDRATDGALKRATAHGFYWLFNSVSPVPIPKDAGDFRLMDRRVVDEVKTLRERTRFMKGLMAWPGFRTVAVPFERAERAAGRSTWNYWKLWNFALDGITSFSTAPLRLWLYLGTAICLLSFGYVAFIIIDALVFGNAVPGYPSLMAAIFFFGGIQLLSIGLLGEYIGRIFQETKSRPIYLIDEIE